MYLFVLIRNFNNILWEMTQKLFLIILILATSHVHLLSFDIETQWHKFDIDKKYNNELMKKHL